MCGILGTYGFDQDVMAQALAQIAHRGPDDLGIFQDGPLWLGMRRLSIIDLGGSKQPIFNEDRSLAIIFNGEIYNYQELRRTLLADGHTLATEGDTETIVHLYETYGPACIHLLRGMFAFALWDARNGTLFVARDRLGIKPLYYAWDGARLAFASEIKALRVLPHVGRAVDPVALEQYLACRYVPGPRTMYAGILKLQPGHTLTLQGGNLRVERYWAPVVEGAYDELTPAEAAAELYRVLDDATRRHLVADVPLGALLSGGVDSAAIVGLMAQHSNRRVQTFTVGFGGMRSHEGFHYDETAAARLVASHFNTEHHEVHVDAGVAELLPRLMWHFDEPVADPAALPTYLISRFARQSVTVALSGEGADELLGGYPRYFWATCAQRAQQVLPPSVARAAVWGAGQLQPQHRRQAALLLQPMPPLERHVAWTGGASAWQRRALLRHAAVEPLPQRQYLDDGVSIHAFMRADITTWLVDEVLMKADKMSMATSLELRVPFLDHQVVEFVTSLPEALKRPVPVTKPLLRSAMRTLLPASALRATKHAFSVPIAEWLRTDLRCLAQDLLFPGSAADHGLFDRPALRRLWHEHLSGRQNHEGILWTLLCFEVWHTSVFLRPTATDYLCQGSAR